MSPYLVVALGKQGSGLGQALGGSGWGGRLGCDLGVIAEGVGV